MKTTLDLPDHLMKRVKIRAVHEHKKLKDAVVELIECGPLGDRLARTTHSSSLDTTARFGITAHDARFLALARQIGLRLTTEDKQLRAAAPLLTQSVEDALARI